MVPVKRLVEYCDGLLEAAAFRDYCPNGLQVEGVKRIEKLVTGVTASQALIDAAAERGADALLVHHGFFWKGERSEVVGVKYRRLAALIKHDINLIAYHLPLDAHPKYGNNTRLGKLLGLSVQGRFGRDAGDELAMYGEWETAMEASRVSDLIERKLARRPMHIAGRAEQIKRVAWCSGAAQSYIEAAAAMGVDAFISGEVSESTTHLARELGVHYFAAGHHATERYGVKALGDHLSEMFGLECEFIDIENPV